MVEVLPVTLDATYHNGSLTLEQTLSLPDGTRLRVTIATHLSSNVLTPTDEQIVRKILEEDAEVFEALGQ